MSKRESHLTLTKKWIILINIIPENVRGSPPPSRRRSARTRRGRPLPPLWRPRRNDDFGGRVALRRSARVGAARNGRSHCDVRAWRRVFKWSLLRVWGGGAQGPQRRGEGRGLRA